MENPPFSVKCPVTIECCVGAVEKRARLGRGVAVTSSLKTRYTASSKDSFKLVHVGVNEAMFVL